MLNFVGSLTGLTQSGPQIDRAAVGYLPRAASALPNPPSIPSGSGKQYWVSPNGSDTADGLGQATAFKTLQRAQSVANPGDVLNVLPGTYTAPNARECYRSIVLAVQPLGLLTRRLRARKSSVAQQLDGRRGVGALHHR